MGETSIATTRNGAILWILSIQYYIVQFLVGAAWAVTNTYSLANNTISDLANTQCGLYGSRLVCSPLHVEMNLSFIILGVSMITGAVLLQQQLAHHRAVKLGFYCIMLAGVGTIMVGLFPENSVRSLHILGAALPFSFGNIGMILLGVGLKKLPIALRTFTIFSGALGMTALLFFMSNTYLGLGIGGMERVVSYPLTIWMIVFGSYLLYTTSTSKSKS